MSAVKVPSGLRWTSVVGVVSASTSVGSLGAGVGLTSGDEAAWAGTNGTSEQTTNIVVIALRGGHSVPDGHSANG